MMTKRAAIYARVSTEMQEREGTSLESQEARCRAYAEEQGWTVEHVIKEQGSGGDIDGRPKLLGLLTLAKAGQLITALRASRKEKQVLGKVFAGLRQLNLTPKNGGHT